MQKGERSKENKEWPSKISDRSEKQKTKAIRSKKDWDKRRRWENSDIKQKKEHKLTWEMGLMMREEKKKRCNKIVII